MENKYIILGLNKTQEEIELSQENYEQNLQIILDEIDDYLQSLNLFYGRTMNKDKEDLFELYKFFDYYLTPQQPSAVLIKKIACDKCSDINFNAIARDIRTGDFDAVKTTLTAELKDYAESYKELKHKTNSEKYLARKARQQARRAELANRMQEAERENN